MKITNIIRNDGVKKTAIMGITAMLAVLTATGCGNKATDSSESPLNSDVTTNENVESETEKISDTLSGDYTEEVYTVGTYDGELRPLRIAVCTGQTDHYLALVGKEQGIFEKYGIDLSITEYANGVGTVDSVVQGLSDVGMIADYAFVNRVGNTLSNTNLILISDIFGTNTNAAVKSATGVYVAPKYADDLSSLDGSEGIYTMAGTIFDYFDSKVIEYLGLDEENQNIVVADSMQTAVALAQTGDISFAYVPGAMTQYFEKFGWVKVASGSDINATTHSYYVTTTEIADANKELLADFLAAVDETFDYITDNTEEAGTYLEGALGLTKDNFVADWADLENRIGFAQDNVDILEGMEEWAYKRGNYDKEFDVKDFIDTDILKIFNESLITFE
jgi:NitT/TauT family transport system substrate-binding protein